MKTIRLFAMAAAVCTILFACTQVIEPETVIEEQPEATTPAINPGVFALTLSMPETKTVFGEGDGSKYPKKWSVGDKIKVNGIESDALTAEQGAGTNTATFTFSSDPEAPYNVVYPSSAYDSVTGKVTIPATQTYVEGSFDPAADIILGYGTTPDGIDLHNAVAYLKIRLKSGDYGNFGVSSIKLSAADKKLNGAFAIGGGNTELTVPDSSSDESEETITLNVGGVTSLSDTPKEFLIAVAPQTLAGGFTVTVTDPKGNTMEKSKASSATLAAGKILAQQAFKFQEYVSIKTPDNLLSFAADCCAGSSNYYVIENNIDMDGQKWPAAGTGDAKGTAFNGVLDGGNEGTENGGWKISNLKSTTGSFINFAYSSSVIKNVTLDGTCSFDYSDAITANCNIGAIVGMTRGNVSYCFNRAPVNCTSTSYTKPIYVGGIAGRLYRLGSIDHCYNYATVSCEAAGGSEMVCMGGIVGSVERNSAGDNATISNCESSAAVDRGTISDDAKSSPTYVGGIIGRLMSKSGADKMTVTNLIHSTGNVSINYETRNDGVSVFVGGLIGGIHGETVSNAAADVDVTNSHVEDCTVNNGYWNNTTDYGTAPHAGGLVGLSRGVTDGTQNICIKEDCYVNNVSVTARRGYFGGLVSWMRGTFVDYCDVLASSVKSSAQGFIAGGIAACAYDSVISNCNVTLTKNSSSSLYTRGSYFYTGGIAGWVRGTSTIENCKAYVRNMYQATETAGVRGWIAGYCNGTSTTINNCGLGGTYGDTTPTITLDGENYTSYIYGSSSTNVTVGTGANACYYWDGTL